MFRTTLRWLAQRSRLALVAGIFGTAALALGTTSSLGGFTASITNTGDKVAAGSLLMQEQVTPSGGTTSTCLSTAAATAITTNSNNGCTSNKFGSLLNAVPGASSFSTVVVANQGSVTANSFTMGTGSCTATPTTPSGATAANVGSDTAFCNKVDVTIEDDTNNGSPSCVYPAGSGACPAPANTSNLATLSSAYASTPLSLTAPVAAGASRTYKVTVMLDTTATNADQAMAATEPITFNFGS